MRLKSTCPIAIALLASAVALPPVAAAAQAITIESQSVDIDTAHNIIRVGLASGDPSVRVEAIEATGMIAKSQSVRKRIEGFLTDDDVAVRIAAADTLADLGFQESIPALKKALDTDPVPEVQFAAAKALYRLHSPQGKQSLEDVLYENLGTKSSYLTRQKRKFLSHFHSVHGVTVFLLSTGGGLVPVPGAGMGLSEVANLMDDTQLSPRATIVLMLGRLHDPDTDKLLKFALKDKDWTVRASAVLMIALTARKELRQDLVPLMSDNDARVRFRAAGAYLHLIGANAAPEEK